MVSSHETQAQEDDPHTVRIEFEPPLYQCFENCGSLKLTVTRQGGEPGVTVKVCVVFKEQCACKKCVYKEKGPTGAQTKAEITSLTSLEAQRKQISLH